MKLYKMPVGLLMRFLIISIKIVSEEYLEYLVLILKIILKCVKLYTREHISIGMHMNTTTTMTIRLNPELKARLDDLAKLTRRSKSFLAAEAVATYVEQEMAIVEGIKQGLADVKAGRLIPHGQAMEKIYEAINSHEA
jgi:predicted transcriptional regulator